jgi:RNA polymerase sigma-70 factor (ECF subfamily)
MFPMKSDRELVEDFQGGQKDAFEGLMKRHMNSVYNLGYRMCARPEDAEDLVQNTFLNALRYLDSFRGEARFKNWLFRIGVNSCLRMKRGKAGEGGEVSFDENMTADYQPPEGTPAWVREPESHLLDGELREVIDRAVHRLPPQYRLVFVLRDQEGFSTRETGEIMGLSQGAVKTRLHRARAYMAGEIRDYMEDSSHD